MIRAVEAWRRDEGGSSAVEFALIGSLFFLTVIAIIGFGYAFWAKNDLARSIDIAARGAYVMHNLDPEATDYTAVEDVFFDSFTGNAARADISVQTVEIAGVQYLQLDASFVFPIILPLPVLSEGLTLNEQRLVEL